MKDWMDRNVIQQQFIGKNEWIPKGIGILWGKEDSEETEEHWLRVVHPTDDDFEDMITEFDDEIAVKLLFETKKQSSTVGISSQYFDATAIISIFEDLRPELQRRVVRQLRSMMGEV